MAEGLMARITRKYMEAVIPTFQRGTIAQYLPSENIGDRDVTKWALKILKESSRPTHTPAGSNFIAQEDKFDALDAVFHLHKLNKRMSMNRSEKAAFEKNGILPVGVEEIAEQMAKEWNYIFCLGKRDDSQFNITQYNYLTAQNASSTDPENPSLKTSASTVDWDVAGGAQNEIAEIVGNLEVIGGNPMTSIAIIPEVVMPKMRKPIITGTGIYGNISVLQYLEQQGILGYIVVEDTNLVTAAGATPTVEAWDLYLMDIARVAVGYTVPENINVQDNPDGSYNTYIDAEVEYCPVFKPKKATDGYYYKAVSRLTAIDCVTT